MTSVKIAKFNMIEQQIRPWEVLDPRVLTAIGHLNREDFVRPPYKGLAYADCQIPLSKTVRMLPPTIEGRMLQALLVSPQDQILEVGSGCGYVTACLASLARHVTSIDGDAEMIEFAKANVTAGGFDNVEFELCSLAQFNRTDAYQAITVTASLAAIPNNLKDALTIGGRLFVIVGQAPVMQALLVTRVSEAEWTTQSLFETDIPRLAS